MKAARSLSFGLACYNESVEEEFDALEARLEAAPIGGFLTDDDRAAIAEALDDFRRGDFTVAIEPAPAPRLAAEG